MREHVERFYALLDSLSRQRIPLAECVGRSPWPDRGVYFFREPGEHRTSDPLASRIVRVGTHGVSAGAKSTLWGRLRAHRGHSAGGGNHRGSVFRRHVGEALRRRDAVDIDTWGSGSSAPKHVRLQEVEHEQRVSAYLGTMTVEWVDVPDDPGTQSERAIIEAGVIGLLSNSLCPTDPPSPSWLGLRSPADEIRGSGLWNVKHVRHQSDPRVLDLLEAAVRRTVRTNG